MSSILLSSPADGDENYTMHLSGMGSLLSSRPPKICDVCSVSKADLYCAADDAYLCTSCDVEVHSANSLAQRHERVKLGPNGAPMKIERKGGSGDSQRITSSKKADSTMVSVLSANSGSSMSGSKKKKKGKRSSRTHACNAIPLENKISNAVAESKPKGMDRIHNPSYNARVSIPSTDRSNTLVKIERTNDFVDDCMNIRNFLEVDIGGDMGEDVNAMLRAMECCDSMNTMAFPSDHVLENTEEDDFVMDFSDPLPHFSPSTTEVNNSNLQSSSITTSQLDHSSVSTVLPAQPVDCSEQVNRYRSVDCELRSFVKEEFQTEWEDVAWCTNLSREVPNFLEVSSLQSFYPSLQLNYEDVLTAWSEMGGQPWLSSPSVVSVPTDHEDSSTSEPRVFGHGFELSCMKNGGEESVDVEDRCARVLRYREKRRNRLFCKTIRYEVRKLNAERRPRIKGRFVKRCDTEAI